MKKIIRILLPVLVLATGLGVFTVLFANKPKAQRKERKEQGTLVEVLAVKTGDHDVVVPAQGAVTAAKQVVLQAEVGGRVTWRHKSLVPGGQLKAGESLVKLDASNYQFSLRQQAAAVNRARLDLQVEQGRKAVAEREWALLQKGDNGIAGNAQLARREPQLESAKVAVDAAESQLAQARLNVKRATLKAPFNAFVMNASADKGQLVGPNSQLATLVGTDAFWVQIAMPMENLNWIKVPGVNSSEGAEARVFQQVGEQRVERTGRVVRLLGDLDPVGRMARVLVEIEDPFNLKREGERGLPLLVGAFVNVEIDGGRVENVFEIPRAALREGDRVYVYGKDDKLHIQDLTVVWRAPESVLVRKGLKNGDRIIVSRIGTPVEGMLLRLAGTTPPKAAEPTGPALKK